MIRPNKTALGLVAAIGLLFAISVFAVIRWTVSSAELGHQTPQPYGVGMRVRVSTDPLQGEVLPHQSLVRVPFQADLEQITISVTLTLRSDLPKEDDYALTALWDYTQVPITINNLVDDVHMLKAGPFSTQDVDLTMVVPNLEGRHKVVLLLFRSFGVRRYDERFRYLTDGMLHTFSMDLNIGTDREPEVVYQTMPNARAEAPRISFGGIVINRVSDQLIAWLSDSVSSKSALDYQIHLGNDNHPGSPYAVVAFLDGRQIPITSGGDLAFFGHIESNGRVTLPGQVQVPAKGETHELQVLYVLNPFQPEAFAASGTSGPSEVYPRFVPSLRVGLLSTP